MLFQREDKRLEMGSPSFPSLWCAVSQSLLSPSSPFVFFSPIFAFSCAWIFRKLYIIYFIREKKTCQMGYFSWNFLMQGLRCTLHRGMHPAGNLGHACLRSRRLLFDVQTPHHPFIARSQHTLRSPLCRFTWTTRGSIFVYPRVESTDSLPWGFRHLFKDEWSSDVKE